MPTLLTPPIYGDTPANLGNGEIPAPLTSTDIFAAVERAGLVYYVSFSQFEALFATAAQGTLADSSLWTILATGWKTAPVLNDTIGAGDVYDYVFDSGAGDVTYYRLVPSPYDSALDKFYSSFDGINLTGEIATRAITL